MREAVCSFIGNGISKLVIMGRKCPLRTLLSEKISIIEVLYYKPRQSHILNISYNSKVK